MLVYSYMHLNTKVEQLNKVGDVLKKRLHKLGVQTVFDLLHFFPFRYEDYSEIKHIADLQDGIQVSIQGKIELINSKRSPRKRTLLTEAIVRDESDQIRVIWFGQAYIAKVLHVGDEVCLSGQVKQDMFGLQMVSPEYEKIVSHKKNTTHTGRIVAMYHLTAGITHKQMRFLMEQALRALDELVEWIPQDICHMADIVSYADAIRMIHVPDSFDDITIATKRLKFDELFVLQLRAEMIRRSMKQYKAIKLVFQQDKIQDFVSSLSFKLTVDQKKSAWQILQDIARDYPMNRLLEGDVGSGKTVVAGLSLYNTVLNNAQGIIMAPTEILAKQHIDSLISLFHGRGVCIGILTRSMCALYCDDTYEDISRAEMLKKIKQAEITLMVGTHALLSDEVVFKNLALVIVDEQHRFGVEQRKTIREKSGDAQTVPHFLSMTATPIPRSYALALYGDLDISMIKELPHGRKKIITRLVDSHNREKAYQFIHDQVKQGRQVFVICPLIDVSDIATARNVSLSNNSEKKSVMKEYETLKTKIFPHLRIDFLHGKMKSKDKDKTMQAFVEGNIDILVATSVVEVGVNIPNASVMMIEGAERFGLAQLHQFRGRVGRSSYQSYCFLFSESESTIAQERLSLFEKTSDGFVLAEHDLKMRGPGEVYGTAQSGQMHLRMANLQDYDLVVLCQGIARDIDFEKYPSLMERVQEWERGVHLE